MTKDLLNATPPGTGHDWLVHVRIGGEEMELLPIFDRETVEEVLDLACYWLDGEDGENIGTYEIIGILRRDMVGNADEILPRNLN